MMAYAQKVYFIYLQSENDAPFFVKMGDKVYSSTASGYLILSSLVDSTYSFTLGFSGNQALESTFSINMRGNDKGFLLKKSDAALILVNLQNQQTFKPTSSTDSTTTMINTKADHFTRLLSQAADDPSLLAMPAVLKETVAVKPEKKMVNPPKDPQPEPVTAKPVKNDTINHTATNTVAVKPETLDIKKVEKQTDTVQAVVSEPLVKKEPTMQPNIAFKRSKITKRSESSTTEGFGLVFLDNTSEGTDTIQLIIPNPKLFLQTEDTSSTASGQFLDLGSKSVAKSAPANKPQKVICSATASQNDFLNLQRAMVFKKREEGMIGEAKKFFKKKCFATAQIKTLSTLFTTETGKYEFFEAAYLHISDPEQFKTLDTELKEPYYANRFKALISNQ